LTGKTTENNHKKIQKIQKSNLQMKTITRILTAVRHLRCRFPAFPVSRWSDKPVALPNALGLINEHGIETLLLDTASSYNSGNPWPGRGLLVKRGVSGYQYGDLCAGGAGGPLPLGVTLDAPFNSGDPFLVRRLGARPGLELGIGVAGATVTIDKLLVAAAGGCVQDVSTLTVNGTYWVVGRAAASLTAINSTMEVPYVPFDPYQIINTGGTLTFPTNPQ
jgi:hypothetical protein